MSETKTDNYKIGILIDSIEDFDTAQKKNYNRFYFEKYDILLKNKIVKTIFLKAFIFI